ncbi:hypothetical protein [Archaeoglobus sp.]
MGTFYNPDRELTNIREKYPREVEFNGQFIAGRFMRYLLAKGLDKKRVVKFCRYAKVISTWVRKLFEELERIYEEEMKKAPPKGKDFVERQFHKIKKKKNQLGKLCPIQVPPPAIA